MLLFLNIDILGEKEVQSDPGSQGAVNIDPRAEVHRTFTPTRTSTLSAWVGSEKDKTP